MNERRLLLASTNPGKIREIRLVLAGLPLALETLDDHPGVPAPEETGATFAENARAKALYYARATGRPTVPEDSGLEIAALGGAPGIYSARFAGEGATDEANLDKLLRSVPADGDRRVAYVCAIAFVAPGEEPRIFEERCEGRLATEPRGSGGFGYDPAFLPDDVGDGRTMAELPAADKDAISHRGRAARELALHRHVHLVRADAAALPFAGVFDVVFSSATFHWICDHDALFRSIFLALRPGGRLIAQCGGGPNLERLLDRAARLAASPPFRAAFADWVDPWYFATPEETARRLREAGFVDVETGLEPAPTSFADAETYRAFLETVCVREYLARLEPVARDRFARELTAAAAVDTPPYTLDYWRLNLSARRPG